MTVRSQSSLLSEIAVLEAQEIEHTVQSDGVDALFGVGHHARFGVEGDAESGLAEHRQVVGAITHADGVCQVYLLHLGA